MTNQHRQIAIDYAEKRAYESQRIHDDNFIRELELAFMNGMKQHDYMVREKLWEGLTPFLDKDENLAWKEVEQPTPPNPTR